VIPIKSGWALYIDWFNLFTNKIAGKVASCGTVILYCLNLPLEIRFLPENIFIFGIIPGPGMADVWAISRVLRAFVVMMNEWNTGNLCPPTDIIEGFLYDHGSFLFLQI